MKRFKKKLKGYSLVELVLAIGIFAIISSMLVMLVVDSTRTLSNTVVRSKATQLTQEIRTTLTMMKSIAWYSVAQHTDQGAKHIELVGTQYQILEGEKIQDGLSYFFTINRVQRDSSLNLVDSGGSQDPHTRLISITISWADWLGKIHEINPKIYINDWNTNSIVWTSSSDFLQGITNGTLVQELSGGEVRLQSMKYADWCNPSLSLSAHDLPQQGIATTISTSGDIVYMGTGENASGLSFIKATVLGEPPQVTVDGTFDGYKVNDVFGLNGNALLATDSNGEEVVILDITSPTPSKIGFFDSSGPQDATTVFAYENKGFVSHGNNLTIFDLTSKTGSRPQLATISVGSSNSVVTDIYIDDTYVYISLTNHTYELLIYEYKNGLNLVAFADIGDMNTTTLFVSDDKTRIYLGTSTNAGAEFFIINSTTKVGALPVISSYDLGLLSVKALITADKRAMIGGTGGEEYTVLDITNENAPVKCGGLNIDSGINAIALAKHGINLYSYILTKDASQELKIVRGGPGGGGPDGEGFLPSGTYTSNIFDTNSSTAEYYVLSITSTVPVGTSLKLYVRASNSSDMSGIPWIGPGGTAETFFQDTGFYDLPLGVIGRYFQYEAIFESDTIQTPLLEEVVINYEK